MRLQINSLNRKIEKISIKPVVFDDIVLDSDINIDSDEDTSPSNPYKNISLLRKIQTQNLTSPCQSLEISDLFKNGNETKVVKKEEMFETQN